MISFENRGELDPRSIKTFGVSSKEGDNAIGFFGTGLKYAIAILLRTGHGITVQSGEQVYEFTLERHTIRVDDFDLVTMNGEPLAFTTELGKTWELWQAYRELWCNCQDEAGLVLDCKFPPTPEPGLTRVLVCGHDFEQLHATNDIILHSSPLATTPGLEVHPGPGRHFYYRGIRAYTLLEPAEYTYNFTDTLTLTEDRTFANESMVRLTAARNILSYLTDEAVLTKILTSGSAFEKSLDYHGWGYDPSPLFQDTVVALHKEFKPVNFTARRACDNIILSNVARHRPSELDALDEARLAKAIDFATRLDYPVDAYPIVVTDYMGENVLGRAADGTIFISERVFMQGTKQLVATLIEEYLHLKHGLRDETYQMQTFLFDALVTMGERVLKEPL